MLPTQLGRAVTAFGSTRTGAGTVTQSGTLLRPLAKVEVRSELAAFLRFPFLERIGLARYFEHPAQGASLFERRF
jgi:hypothetical protein